MFVSHKFAGVHGGQSSTLDLVVCIMRVLGVEPGSSESGKTPSVNCRAISPAPNNFGLIIVQLVVQDLSLVVLCLDFIYYLI